MQRGNYDHKAFHPHANVHEAADHPNEPRRRPTPFEPEELRRQHVTADHPPVGPVHVAKRAVLEGVKLVRVAAVVGDEKFHTVGVANDRTGHEDHLGHHLEVANRHDLVQTLVQGNQRDHQRHHHREAAKHGTRHEVRRENRRMPTGQLRHGEVERHDRVHRQYQRRGETSQKQVGLLVVAPVTVRAGPAKREQPVQELRQLVAHFRSRLHHLAGNFAEAIAHRGQVRDQAHVPEQHRDCEVCGHREHVP